MVRVWAVEAGASGFDQHKPLLPSVWEAGLPVWPSSEVSATWIGSAEWDGIGFWGQEVGRGVILQGRCRNHRSEVPVE